MRDDYEPRTRSSGSMIAIIVLVAIIAGVAFYVLREQAPETAQTASTPVVATPQAPTNSATSSVAPIVEYEAPEPVVEVEPLPGLNESDSSILAALQQLRGEGLVQLLVPQEVIRKFVLAVNNIAEGKVIHEYRPVVSPTTAFAPETFSVVVDGNTVDQERVAQRNYERYEAYVTTLALIDSDAAVAVYRRFYPLLEEAFRELGLKKPNFHSVMIAAIDNVLAAPDAQGDLLLVRPKVFYQYADPALEQLPQTHKLMLRMGPENARSVKASLRQLRARLIN